MKHLLIIIVFIGRGKLFKYTYDIVTSDVPLNVIYIYITLAYELILHYIEIIYKRITFTSIHDHSGRKLTVIL